MNIGPVVTAGGIAGIILAGWEVLAAQGLFSFLTTEAQDALNIFVGLVVPVVAALIARSFVTPVDDPALPVGSEVTLLNSDGSRSLQTGTVERTV